ncbi:MAG TPA: alpha/beta hydrolase-fold protein [Pseudonocardia sp.]|jgi:enterochelin esterase family protein|uniref:alpha/beta hydrolase-fold protein n=1 Tax=Pseudonocardia sp. TaxID=60912 RepID=UPI002B4AE3CD|nr:alpha/beta hydrolase-fold protein [Pseudonocardia sp.]HLU60451.1 alpha/beta hydrolase-fold protein [Pseudonocardia sp.]
MSRLAINRLKERKPDAAAVDRFLARHDVPIVEGDRCTFLWRGEADEVFLVQRIVGLPERLPLRRLWGTDLWYLVLELPPGSRINYQVEVRRGDRVERGNDPLNPKVSYSPVGTSSVCFAHGYTTPDWTEPDPDARPGELTELVLPSRALRRDCRVTVYLPARLRRTAAYPLLVVHDGGDFLQYAAAKTVLDNLIHRLDVAETVVAFVDPGDRLAEYADSTAHARFLTRELVPRLEADLPLVAQRSGRCLLGSSFGAVASLATAYRAPDFYGSLVLMSGSFVFTDIGAADHGGGPVFDPVVRFVNRYRQRPRRLADRLFVSCGVYEPLITANRSIVHTFESTGMAVRFVETRDGHDWENWRDTLRDALAWVYPGPQKLVYE